MAKRIWFPPSVPFDVVKQIKLQRTNTFSPGLWPQACAIIGLGQREIRGALLDPCYRGRIAIAHHELWLPRIIHHLILRLLAQVQWIIPKVQKFNVMHVPA